MATERMPAGLAYSVIVLAVSLSVLLGMWHLQWPVAHRLQLVVHGLAGLCLFWSLVRFAVNHEAIAFARRPAGQDLLAVLRLTVLVTGWVVLLIMAYAAATEIIYRVLALRFPYAPQGFHWREPIWSGGLIDLGILATAVLIRWRSSGNNQLVTNIFWILVFASLWGALQIPPLRGVATEGHVVQAVETSWASVFIFGCGVVMMAFTLLEGHVRRRHRVLAWPHHLEKLTELPEEWPGFRYSAGILSVFVLLMGCIFILHPWTSIGAFLVGVSLLVLASRRWNENLADAGLAAITLGVVAICMIGISGPRIGESSEQFAEIFNRVVLGLAIMTGFWHWLAGVWDQQLDQGQAWTTAGRMIRTARRVGFLIGIAGVLVAAVLAIWPRRPFVEAMDDSTYRWVFGLLANGLLIMSLLFAARLTKKYTLGWLTLFAIAVTGAFAFVRAPHSWWAQFLVAYWPMALAIVSGFSLLGLYKAMKQEGWQAFVEPTFALGVLIGPLCAAGAVMLGETEEMASWMPSVTFVLLAVVYALAAFLPGPRAFLGIAVVCLGMGGWYLRQIATSHSISSPYFFIVIILGSVILFTLLYRRQK